MIGIKETGEYTWLELNMTAEYTETSGAAYLDMPDLGADSEHTPGGRLTKARLARGLSALEIAQQLGLDEETVLEWEADRSEPLAHLQIRLAGLLGVQPAWLIEGRGDLPATVSEQVDIAACQAEIAELRRQLVLANQQLDKLAGLLQAG